MIVKSQRYFQIFYFERLLERISKSKYNGEIFLKGGLLLSSIICDDNRNTKDMDTTLKEIMFDKRVFIDKIILKSAIKSTFENRIVINIDEFKNIVNDIANDYDMKYKWNNIKKEMNMQKI